MAAQYVVVANETHAGMIFADADFTAIRSNIEERLNA
jgi:hypothetical protein